MVFSFSIPRFYQVSLRGAAPSVHPSALPKVGAAPPQPPWGGRSAPPTPGLLRGWQPLHPPAGAPPCTRVTFPTRGKSPKARQGLPPLDPAKGDASLPLRFPHPLDRVCTSNPDRFATLSRWANRFYSFPKLYRGSHPLLSIRGSVGGMPPRMPLALFPRNQYR